MPLIQTITPCLWFDDQSEEAADFYVGIFKRSKVVGVSRYGEAGRDIHRKPPGSVMTVDFELDGQRFTALNGGPGFRFNESISFQVHCETQADVDYYWERLSRGGDPDAQQCGWLKDKFGISWQIVPAVLRTMMQDADTAKSQRVMQALLKMKKFDVAQLERAYAG